MTNPTNLLQQVRTYQAAALAYLQNTYCLIDISNKKFKNFQTLTANLGTTVDFELPYRFRAVNSLIAQFEPTEQRLHPLTVNQQASVSVAYTAQEILYNVQDYMQKIGKGAMQELGSQVEISMSRNAVDHTYRVYNQPLAAISTRLQLDEIVKKFTNYGAVNTGIKSVIPDVDTSAIVNNMLGQFALDRNNELTPAWELGNFSYSDWYASNLLATHIAGNVGQNATTLTVVSTNDPTGANITQITFSGAGASDADAIKSGDILTFQDGVSGQPDLRYLTFIGHTPSANEVSVRATADAGADGAGNVTVNIYPALVSVNNRNQNILHNIVAGMQVTSMDSHKAGFIYSGDALFLGMPMLPDQSPYTTANKNDPDTGCSMRMTYGAQFGQNSYGMIHDTVWGTTMVDEYAMRIAFPL